MGKPKRENYTGQRRRKKDYCNRGLLECIWGILYGIYSIHLNVRVVYGRKLVLAVTTWSNMYALGTPSLPPPPLQQQQQQQQWRWQQQQQNMFTNDYIIFEQTANAPMYSMDWLQDTERTSKGSMNSINWLHESIRQPASHLDSHCHAMNIIRP